jgi:hypothetical protein
MVLQENGHDPLKKLHELTKDQNPMASRNSLGEKVLKVIQLHPGILILDLKTRKKT